MYQKRISKLKQLMFNLDSGLAKTSEYAKVLRRQYELELRRLEKLQWEYEVEFHD